jgi:glycosyltransferase involved in cell wall biosynthesis
MTSPDKPLVTFALFAYNQERFIREAVEGAFSQTYSPLEIVLSDDCSSDRTFEIMKEMAESYKGPHRIILNRNENNLGLGAHVNRIMKIANGELIVAAAGDDISLSHRTARLVQSWFEQDCPPALCSRFQLIGSSGERLDTTGWVRIFDQFVSDAKATKEQRLRTFIKSRSPALLGCTEVWHRSLFDTYGDLNRRAIQEDVAVSLRALLQSEIGYVHEELVLYRAHDANLWGRRLRTDRSVVGFSELENMKCFRARSELNLLIGFRRDLRMALRIGSLPRAIYEDLVAEIGMLTHVAYLRGYWWRIRWHKKAYYSLFVLIPQGSAKDWTWALPRLMPRHAFLHLRSWLSRAKNAARGAYVLSVTAAKVASRIARRYLTRTDKRRV